MLKKFNDYAKARFAQEMAECYPEFRPKKSLRGPLAGALNFAYQPAADKRGWLSFGGFKEDSFAVMAAWTTDDTELKLLEEWEQYPNPNAFDAPPIPGAGFVDLRHRWRFENDDDGPYFPLEIGEPPAGLSEMVFDRYANSQQCEDEISKQYVAVLRMYTRNPPSVEQHRLEFLHAEKVSCRLLWTHLATRHDFSAGELARYLDPVVAGAMDLVHKYGVPLIARQLGTQIERKK